MRMKTMFRVGFLAGCAMAARGAEAAPKIEQVIVAIEGFCPVSYQTVGAPTPGVPNFASEYSGYTYFLASAKAKELFDKDPGRYAPQIGGMCPVGLGGPYGNKFASDPRVFAVIDKKLYLISSARAKRSFDQKPGHYISRAMDLYNEPAIGGYCPISYLSGGKPVKGVKEFAREFRGQIFYLAGAKEAEILATKGAAAMPEYEGSCAEGVSRGKRFPGNPLIFATFLGKAYLFYDEEAKTKFMAKATTLVDEANAKWPSIRLTKGPTGGP